MEDPSLRPYSPPARGSPSSARGGWGDLFEEEEGVTGVGGAQRELVWVLPVHGTMPLDEQGVIFEKPPAGACVCGVCGGEGVA